MEEKINSIKAVLSKTIPNSNIEYQFDNEFHKFCIKSEQPTCWLYLDRDYIDDSDEVSLINLVRIYHIEDKVLKGDKSYWLYLSDNGLHEVGGNFTKTKP